MQLINPESSGKMLKYVHNYNSLGTYIRWGGKKGKGTEDLLANSCYEFSWIGVISWTQYSQCLFHAWQPSQR